MGKLQLILIRRRLVKCIFPHTRLTNGFFVSGEISAPIKAVYSVHVNMFQLLAFATNPFFCAVKVLRDASDER